MPETREPRSNGPLLGVDVGGSAVKLGAVDLDGRPVAEESLAVRPDERASSFFDRLAAAVRGLGEEAGTPVRALGLGVAGLVDRERGVVQRSPNLPWIEGAAVRDELARRLDLVPGSVEVENDANAAALGERWVGAAREATDFLFLTLGTGIGGGLVLGGRPYRGAGLAGEVGHLSIDPRGPACPCGSRGCLETYASATAARRRALERGLPPESPGDLELLSARAAAGPGAERELLEEIGRDLGHGIGLVVTALDLRTFVLGGGFSAAFASLEPGVRRGIGERAFGERVPAPRLLRAELGARAGWIGAASLAREAGKP